MIYLDLDGVLADFDAYVETLGIPRNEKWHQPKSDWRAQDWKREGLLRDAMFTSGFWLSLPLMPGAVELYDFACTKGSVTILTAKPRVNSPDWLPREKEQWVTENFGRTPFICCLRSEKSDYATEFSPIYGSIGDPNILVDDHPENCFKWSAAGGQAIMYQSAEQVMQELSDV